MMRMGQWMLIKRVTDLCSCHCTHPPASATGFMCDRRKSKDTSSQGHETEDIMLNVALSVHKYGHSLQKFVTSQPKRQDSAPVGKRLTCLSVCDTVKHHFHCLVETP
jgi:hypothetical protein